MLTIGFVLSAVVVSARAANDWATPCVNGACGYIWDADAKTASSSMMLAGGNQVLSDITEAAGWQIMGCDPNWSKGPHDVRMVCSGSPEQMANCQHLYDNGGAENTVVRLPQNCGTGPFARVQKTYVPQDQSVPANVSKNARRAAANSTQPAVRGLTLDYDFSKIPASRGKLLLGVASSNVGNKPLTRRDLMNLRARGRGRVIAQRGFFDDLGNGVKGAFDDVKDAAGDVVDGAKSVAGDVASAAGAAVDKATSVVGEGVDIATSAIGEGVDKATAAVGEGFDKATAAVGEGFDKATSAVASVATAAATAVADGVKAVKDATTVNESKESDNIPINVDNKFTLIDAAIACEKGDLGGSANLHIDVATKVNANVKFGYTFVGSIVPLQLDDVKVFSTMSGDATATFNIDAEAQGTFDTDLLPLFKSGLPGLTIPGIATLGPEFSLNTRLNMDLDVQAQMSVTTDLNFPNVELAFPQSSGKSSANGADAKKSANPLKLSSQQNVTVTGTVEAHLIPRVDFGIDIGDGLAKATVFLDMDISGELDMQVQASGSSGDAAAAAAGATTNSTKSDVPAKVADAAKDEKAAAKDAETTASAKDAKATAPAKDTKKAAPAKAAKKAAPAKAAKTKRADLGGCVTLKGKFSINGGLDGKLEPLFDDEVSFPIFSKEVNLFTKCFGDAQAPAPAPRSISGGSTLPPAVRGVSGGSTLARRYRHRRAAKAAPAKSLSTKNEITPEASKASTKELTCAAVAVPLGSLVALF